jgi:hypothetical protein
MFDIQQGSTSKVGSNRKNKTRPVSGRMLK